MKNLVLIFIIVLSSCCKKEKEEVFLFTVPEPKMSEEMFVRTLVDNPDVKKVPEGYCLTKGINNDLVDASATFFTVYKLKDSCSQSQPFIRVVIGQNVYWLRNNGMFWGEEEITPDGLILK